MPFTWNCSSSNRSLICVLKTLSPSSSVLGGRSLLSGLPSSTSLSPHPPKALLQPTARGVSKNTNGVLALLCSDKPRGGGLEGGLPSHLEKNPNCGQGLLSPAYWASWLVLPSSLMAPPLLSASLLLLLLLQHVRPILEPLHVLSSLPWGLCPDHSPSLWSPLTTSPTGQPTSCSAPFCLVVLHGRGTHPSVLFVYCVFSLGL